MRHPTFCPFAGQGGVTARETPFHVEAKRAIRDVAISRGWAPTIEARHPDGAWQADVLVEKNGRRIAFEVQWSRQSRADYDLRTRRYASDGIETVWLSKGSPLHPAVLSGLMVIPLTKDGIGTELGVFPVTSAVDACFDYLENDLLRSRVEPIYPQAPCRACGKPWFSTGGAQTWGPKRPFTESELAVLGSWAGVVKDELSIEYNGIYPMCRCPHCGAKQGDFFLDQKEPCIVWSGKVIDRPADHGLSLWDSVLRRLRLPGFAAGSMLAGPATLAGRGRRLPRTQGAPGRDRPEARLPYA